MHEYISKIKWGLLNEVDADAVKLKSWDHAQMLLAACGQQPLVVGASWGFGCHMRFSHCPGEPAIYLETAARSVVLSLIYCWWAMVDHLSKILIVVSGTPAWHANVAAPILKLCPLKWWPMSPVCCKACCTLEQKLSSSHWWAILITHWDMAK